MPHSLSIMKTLLCHLVDETATQMKLYLSTTQALKTPTHVMLWPWNDSDVMGIPVQFLFQFMCYFIILLNSIFHIYNVCRR